MPKSKVSEKSLANLNPIKKGEVRNPNGKPKGQRNTKTIIKEMMGALLTDTEKYVDEFDKEGNPTGFKRNFYEELEEQFGRPICRNEAMVWQMMLSAMKGNVLAFRELLDRSEGKPAQVVVEDKKENYVDFLKQLELDQDD